jgi:addiction module HigA family antidote
MSKKLAPIHPGEILLEEFLKPLDMNPHQLAMALRVPPNRIAQIIKGERSPQIQPCAWAAISVSIRSFG